MPSLEIYHNVFKANNVPLLVCCLNSLAPFEKYEIKDGNKPASARKLSDGELKFKAEWLGEYELVICVDDVLAVNIRHDNEIKMNLF